MDIAQYIGLFLLKNKYCCLQGLGNLEIKRTPTTHNGSELTPAAYFAKLNPIGSLDDAFPNFVATNEQVSIAKASNEISQFVKQSKAKIAAGEKVIIPSIGFYFQQNNQLHFELDPAFSMPTQSIVMPVSTSNKTLSTDLSSQSEQSNDEYPQYNNYNAPKAINWNLIAFWGVIIIIGGSILFWSIRYIINEKSKTEVEGLIPISQPQEVPVVKADSTIIPDSTVVAQQPVNPNDTPEYSFVIKEYNSLASAERRVKQLTSYGYTVSVHEQDSSTFYVVNKIKAIPTDTLKIKDSLTKILNPAGVFILNKAK